MAFDYRKLRGKIKEVFNTQEAFANAMELASTTISKKLNGQIEFSQGEILKAAELLGIGLEEIPLYFFSPDVQKLELID